MTEHQKALAADWRRLYWARCRHEGWWHPWFAVLPVRTFFYGEKLDPVMQGTRFAGPLAWGWCWRRVYPSSGPHGMINFRTDYRRWVRRK